MTYTQQVVVYDHGKPTEHHQFPMPPPSLNPRGIRSACRLTPFASEKLVGFPTCSRRLGLVSQRRCLLEGLRFLMNLGLG